MAKESNYDIMTRQARALFLQYDQQVMVEKFQLEHDNGAIYIPFFGAVHRLDRRTGDITVHGQAAGHNAVMSIYDMLCYSKGRPLLNGSWKTLGSLSQIASWNQQTSVLLSRTAAAFSGKAAALQTACDTLGGRPGPAGDISAVFSAFPFFPVCMQFWEGDEEFPPALQILWDANSLDFVHYETLWYMSGFLCGRLQTQCEI